MNMISNVDQHQ